MDVKHETVTEEDCAGKSVWNRFDSQASTAVPTAEAEQAYQRLISSDSKIEEEEKVDEASEEVKALLQQDEHDDESAIFERGFGFGLPPLDGRLAALAVALLAILVGVLTSSWTKSLCFNTVWVIVVGGGLAGMSAANTVVENGGRTLLLDKSSFCGGNSTKATSGINGAGTKTQKSKSIPDNSEIFIADTLKGGAKKPELAKVLCANSAADVDWLVDKFDLDLSLLARLGGHSQPRTHRGKERFPGMTITYALIQMNGRSVVGCEYRKAGKVIKEFGPMVLASGGFGADFGSDSLLATYRPDLLHLPTTNGEHCTGDAIKMGEAIGAATIDLEWVQVHPTGLVKPDDPDAKVKFLAAEALRGVGGIVLDANGQRFCNELGRRDYVTGEMWKNKPPFRLCLNRAAADEIIWHAKHYTGRGVMKFYPSGEDLAKDMGVPLQTLVDTHQKHYEAAKKQEKDPDGGSFPAYPSGKTWDEPSGKTGSGKKFFHNIIDGSKVATEPFYVAIITPVIHYCMGGLECTVDAECFDKSGKVIPGLYVAGEAAGGIHGNNRLGGNSLLDCAKLLEKLQHFSPQLCHQIRRLEAIDGQQLTLRHPAVALIVDDAAVDRARHARRRGAYTIVHSEGRLLHFDNHLTLGGIACAMSHRLALEAVVKHPTAQWGIILEDDIAALVPKAEEVIQKAIEQLPEDWDALFLGYHDDAGRAHPGAFEQPAGEPIEVSVRPMREPCFGLFAWVVRRPAAEALLQHLFPIGGQVDHAISSWLVQERGRCYQVEPGSMVFFSPKSEEAEDSDIQTMATAALLAPMVLDLRQSFRQSLSAKVQELQKGLKSAQKSFAAVEDLQQEVALMNADVASPKSSDSTGSRRGVMFRQRESIVEIDGRLANGNSFGDEPASSSLGCNGFQLWVEKEHQNWR
eukprot:g21156.t1